jgi:nitrogen fixation/metabolism regulation signal transduction histidine kinase
MVNIPESIRIGSCDYKVDFTDKDLVANCKEVYARINYDNHLIEINNKLGDKQHKELSFLHEMFHGIIRNRNLEIEDEELIVEELARGLHQIIRDNQEIFINREESNV